MTNSNQSPAVDASQVLSKEKTHVKEHFIEQFNTDEDMAYLKTDYKRFLEETYPDYIYKHYPKLDPNKYPAQDAPEYGLALSGGGIRSASFAIGVIQALKNKSLFQSGPSIYQKLNYLSTASGGGYTGSSLSWYQRIHNFFPFGNINHFSGTHNSQDEENKILNYIRQHGKYLTPHQLGTTSLISTILLSIFHSLVAYTLLFSLFLFGLMAAAKASFINDNIVPEPLVNFGNKLLSFSDKDISPMLLDIRQNVFETSFLVFVILFFVFTLITLVYGISSFFMHWLAENYGFRLKVQKALGWLLQLQIMVFVLSTLPIVTHYFYAMDIKNSISVASLSSAFGVLLSLKQMKNDSNNGKPPGLLANIISTLVVLSVIFVFFVISFLIAEYLTVHSSWVWLIPVIVLAALFIFFVNTNQISPHKMYRDRLMETFLKSPDTKSTASLQDRGAEANETLMSELKNSSHWSPYHLINTNVILKNAIDPKYRGRMGDSFVLSPLYCGSDATRYIETTEFIDGKLTLATAMSISGAALNPYAGVSGIGKTTNPFVSYLLTFFGLRLGYWVFNPSRSQLLSQTMRPNYLMPGLADLLGFGHKEDSVFVELSDGGHFDNTGLYELVRRRVPVIILSDGSADPDANFDDFGNAVERIRVDFGTRIRFIDDDYDLSGIQPGSYSCGKQNSLYAEKYKLSKRGYAIGDIVYPKVGDQEAFIGKLVYIKAVLIKDLPRDLYAYKAANPNYPNQPTTDQFFDQRQFESYRELGYQLTKQFLEKEKDKALKMIP